MAAIKIARIIVRFSIEDFDLATAIGRQPGNLFDCDVGRVIENPKSKRNLVSETGLMITFSA